MTDVSESQLPGMGVRYEFLSRSGDRVAVVAHRSGRREVYLGDRRDPDAFHEVLELNDDESRTLAELLGGSRVTRELSRLRQSVQGLAIDWVPVDRDSPYADKTIGDTGTRTRTGCLDRRRDARRRGDPGARPGVRPGGGRHVGGGRRATRDRRARRAAARRLTVTAASLIELGGVILGLAILARLANRFGLPSIPLYLLAGLAFGEGGLLDLGATASFVETGSEIGLILLLFLVGLEYSASELLAALRSSIRAGVLNLALTFPPGAITALHPRLGRDPGVVHGRYHVRRVFGRHGEDPERSRLGREPRDAARPVDHDHGGPRDGGVPAHPRGVPDRWIHHRRHREGARRHPRGGGDPGDRAAGRDPVEPAHLQPVRRGAAPHDPRHRHPRGGPRGGCPGLGGRRRAPRRHRGVRPGGGERPWTAHAAPRSVRRDLLRVRGTVARSRLYPAGARRGHVAGHRDRRSRSSSPAGSRRRGEGSDRRAGREPGSCSWHGASSRWRSRSWRWSAAWSPTWRR